MGSSLLPPSSLSPLSLLSLLSSPLLSDQRLGAVGVLVSVESGVEGEGAGLASGGEGFAVLGGDQSQKVIGVVLAGSDADGKSRDWEAWEGDSVLLELDVEVGSDWQGLEDRGVEVD